jgi:hypothetical protein
LRVRDRTGFENVRGDEIVLEFEALMVDPGVADGPRALQTLLS